MPPKPYLKTAKCQSYVSPEDVKLNMDYAFTLNPKYQLNDKKDRFKFFKLYLSQYLQFCLKDFIYYFYVEKSNKGRLHLHGVVKFVSWEQSNKFYDWLYELERTNQFSYKFGDIKELLNNKDNIQYKTWYAYCAKQNKYWSRLGYDSMIESTTVVKPITQNILNYFQ